MQLNTTNVLLVILGIILVLCFILILIEKDTNIINKNYTYTEGFDPVVDSIQAQLANETPEQLKGTIKTLQQRLIDYGYAPDLNSYVKKTELNQNSGKCLVSTAEDRDLYVSKTDVPQPGPRIDLSQYVKKSSIPPEKVCPQAPEIDYSAYVKKSTLPPVEQCPPCIAPKVKVSAGLCRECPPAPSCPPPERCPELKCPPPAPCPPQPTSAKCDEIRYIKVPTVITKTITLDANGNVMSQQVDSGVPNQQNQQQQNQQQQNQQKQNQKQQYQQQVQQQEYQKQLQQYQQQLQQYQQQQSAKTSNTPNTPNTPNTTNSSNISNIPITTIAQVLSPYQPQTTHTNITPQGSIPTPTNTKSSSILSSIFSSNQNSQIPSTTFPAVSNLSSNTILSQTLDTTNSNCKSNLFQPPDLNSEFKKYGIYGI